MELPPEKFNPDYAKFYGKVFLSIKNMQLELTKGVDSTPYEFLAYLILLMSLYSERQ